MSKQATALSIYLKNVVEDGQSRKGCIGAIAISCDVGIAYASTLYSKAKNTATANGGMTGTKPSSSTTHTKPSTSTTISEFTKGNCREVDAAIVAALKVVEAQFGVTIKAGGGSYNANQFTTKLTVSTGDGTDAAKSTWNTYAPMFGLTADDFGKTFTVNGSQYTITGCKPRRRKYPITAVSSRGAAYKFTAEQVKRNLGK